MKIIKNLYEFDEKYKEDYSEVIEKEKKEVKLIAKHIQTLMPHINFTLIHRKVDITKYNYATSWIKAVSKHLNSDRDKRWIKNCYEAIRIYKNRPTKDFGTQVVTDDSIKKVIECLLN